MFQTTIQNPASCYGLGVHSGRKTQLTLKPAKANTGILLVRTDVTSLSNTILAHYQNVSDTTLSTVVSNNSRVKVSTIEHIMAALWGCGIDNVIIELDGEEVPIMDGSSKPFVFMLEYAGIKILPHPRRSLKILKEVSVSNGDSVVSLRPSDSFSTNIIIDFESKAIGRQEMGFTSEESFKDLIAGARTFGFLHELEYLKSRGLAQGASLENAIGIENDKILNEGGLRFDNEFVRHKLLDSIGDIFTAGGFVIGRMEAYKPGHLLNNELLRKLFENTGAWSWV
ncbi:MAG: UDP-3-O-acyl-N-acetylglucosamine deacetylase [Pseudomonadota bacterium]